MALTETAVPDDASAFDARLKLFVADLGNEDFCGDVDDSVAARLVNATDNSIYHVEPALVVYPRNADDLSLLARLSQRHRIAITARGGCTGTNGQSLTPFVVVDLSRHMNAIIRFDPSAQTVTVEPGVVLNQLNDYLRPLGFFFAPTVSTASRATLGGMLATDASGKGSRRYGRTSDHVSSMVIVMDDGSRVEVADAALCDLVADKALTRLGSICRMIAEAVTTHSADIQEAYPDMNRGLTGYNLKEVVTEDGGFRLSKLLAGSEGTLALTAEMTFKVTRKPRHRALCVLAYDDCLTALGEVERLVLADPVAVEFIDDKVVALAEDSPLWSGLETMLGNLREARGLLFLEFAEHSAEAVAARMKRLDSLLQADRAAHIGRSETTDATEMAALWSLRERSVGLLASMEGARRGIAFVEDVAVPPKNLVAFVKSFRTLLDGYRLQYGMFGHADVGCIHVRPMLDMKDPADRALVREISDKVARLARTHGGLIWGEHGKGYRGEYLSLYVGGAIHDIFRRIKAAFDPNNLLNPGKLVSPAGSDVDISRLDTVGFRGARDASIDKSHQADFERAIACNGNGACFNPDAADAMCPSYKASRDRTQSPKGRAALFREWARISSVGGNINPVATALKTSLDTCLSCNACSSQCPVQVDIPAMKARFLETYYETERRPIRDRVLRHLERLTLIGASWPRLGNFVVHNPASVRIAGHVIGLRDLPKFPICSLAEEMKRARVDFIDPDLPLPSGVDPEQCVILVPDSFSGVFEPHLWAAAAMLFRRMGFRVLAAPILKNGKALNVRGFGAAFSATALATGEKLSRLADTGAHLVAIEPAITLLFRQEYRRLMPNRPLRISSIDEFLTSHLDTLSSHAQSADDRPYRLFVHCTEQTAEPRTAGRWEAVFQATGRRIELAHTGCCGMAGLFGHETEHVDMSRRLFDLSWAAQLDQDDAIPLITGYSCRSQTKRLWRAGVRHPIEALQAEWS